MAKSRKSTSEKGRPGRSALPFLFVIVLLTGAAGYWYGTKQNPPTPTPPTGKIQVTTPQFDPSKKDVVNVPHDVPVDPNKDPIRQAVEAQVADGKTHSAFPSGTKLVRLDVKDGTATLDFSKEFSGVNNSGDTGESLAYDALRKVLAQFENVKYMRVEVDGKLFEGEHSGAWAEVPVRDEKVRVGEKR
jgi:spore germination protein GerM